MRHNLVLVYGLGTGEVQQQLHFSSNPGAGTARMSRRAGEWFGSAPPSAIRIQPSSAMSFGPQGYPSQNSGDRSSGVQRTVADAAAGNMETVHSFGLQLDHQIRNTPVRDLYGMFEQEGRRDPMLLGLIRRLEEAEARAHFASTTQSVADFSGSTGKVPMYRSGPMDEDSQTGESFEENGVPPSRKSTPAREHDVHVLARELRCFLHEDRCSELFEVVQRLELDELAELAAMAERHGIGPGTAASKWLEATCRLRC